jgi:hypothetical protein
MDIKVSNDEDTQEGEIKSKTEAPVEVIFMTHMSHYA